VNRPEGKDCCLSQSLLPCGMGVGWDEDGEREGMLSHGVEN
jgi:hypothetical protein